jgi:hypothetical protein
MLSWRPSGLIVAGLEHTEAARAMMANAGIPVVEVMDVDGAPVAAAVGISHESAGRDMAREIVRRGYRKIAYLGSSSIADHRAQKRLKGFREGLAEAGLTPSTNVSTTACRASAPGRAMTEQVLTRHPEADFLYYNTDINAAGGLLYCLGKGMDIPGRIGLAGSTPSRFSTDCRCASPPWTAAVSRSAAARRTDRGQRADRRCGGAGADVPAGRHGAGRLIHLRGAQARQVRRVSALPRALGVTDQGGQPVKAVHHLGVGRGQEERQNRPQMQRKKRRHKAGARCRV